MDRHDTLAEVHGARAMSFSVYATLAIGEARVMMKLVPDPARRSRALAHALGFAISHLDADPAEPVRSRIDALKRALGGLDAAPADERVALPRIARAMSAAIPGARLVVRRRLPVDQRTPVWPVTMRSGAPAEAGRFIWPYDAELAGLLIGRRKLILRESMTLALAEADAAWLSSHGIAVRHADARGPHRLFASTDAAILDEAAARHAAACAGDEGFREAARWMGAALGYPSCCVESFVRVRMRDDLTLFAELLPPLPHAPMSPLVGWLDGAVALLSYAPCSPECAPSRALAEALIDEIERRSPGFSSRWRALARRVHALTADGRCFAIAAEGDLVEGGALRVIDAVRLTPPEGADLSRLVTPAGNLTGRELRVERGLLVAPELPGWVATLVADHRA